MTPPERPPAGLGLVDCGDQAIVDRIVGLDSAERGVAADQVEIGPGDPGVDEGLLPNGGVRVEVLSDRRGGRV